MEMTLYIIASFVLGALIVFGPCYLIIWLFHKSQSNKYANNTKDVIPLEEQYPEARKILCSMFGAKLSEIPVSEWTAENWNRFFKSFGGCFDYYKKLKDTIYGEDLLIAFIGVPIGFYTHTEIIGKYLGALENIATFHLGYKCHVEMYHAYFLVRKIELLEDLRNV